MRSSSRAVPAGRRWSAIAPARPRTRPSPTSSSRWGPGRSRAGRRRAPSGSPSTTASCVSRASSATARAIPAGWPSPGRLPVGRRGVGSGGRYPRMSRLVDRGAITAAYVGIGMALTIVVSFMLFIPIEWFIWILALPSGLLIGYYANQRSDRRAGPWGRILVNGLFAGFVTGLTAAVLLLSIKALFFFGDDGFRDPGQGGRVTVEKDDGRPAACQTGADCVYQRYLQAGRGEDLVGRRCDRPRLVHDLLLEGTVRECRHDPADHDHRRTWRRGAVWRLPAEARRGGRDRRLGAGRSPDPGLRRNSNAPGRPGASSRWCGPEPYSLVAAFFVLGAAFAVALAAVLGAAFVVAAAFLGAAFRRLGLGEPVPWSRSPLPGPPRWRRSTRLQPWRRLPRPGPSCSARRVPCRPRSGRPWPCRPCRQRCGPWRPWRRRPCRSS